MFLRCWEEVGQMPTYDKILNMLTNFLRGFWVRGRVVVTGLYLSRLTVLCTVHALCVATLVQAIVLQVFLVAQECGFRLMATRVCR